MFVALEQVVEQQVVDPLGVRIDAHPRIEVRWAAFYDHYERVCVRLTSTSQERTEQQDNIKKPRDYIGRAQYRPRRLGLGIRRATAKPYLTHTKSSPGSRPFAPRWPTAHSTGAGSTSHMQAKQMPPPLSPPTVSQTLPTGAAKVPSAIVHSPALRAERDCL